MKRSLYTFYQMLVYYHATPSSVDQWTFPQRWLHHLGPFQDQLRQVPPAGLGAAFVPLSRS